MEGSSSQVGWVAFFFVEGILGEKSIELKHDVSEEGAKSPFHVLGSLVSSSHVKTPRHIFA